MDRDELFERPAERRAGGAAHVIGEPLDALSIAQLDDRIVELAAEMRRLEAARDAKTASARAAEAVFRL